MVNLFTHDKDRNFPRKIRFFTTFYRDILVFFDWFLYIANVAGCIPTERNINQLFCYYGY